jgi:hypothetical protein
MGRAHRGHYWCDAARRILAHVGLPSTPPPLARARDPTDDDNDEVTMQLSLNLAWSPSRELR